MKSYIQSANPKSVTQSITQAAIENIIHAITNAIILDKCNHRGERTDNQFIEYQKMALIS